MNLDRSAQKVFTNKKRISWIILVILALIVLVMVLKWSGFFAQKAIDSSVGDMESIIQVDAKKQSSFRECRSAKDQRLGSFFKFTNTCTIYITAMFISPKSNIMFEELYEELTSDGWKFYDILALSKQPAQQEQLYDALARIDKRAEQNAEFGVLVHEYFKKGDTELELRTMDKQAIESGIAIDSHVKKALHIDSYPMPELEQYLILASFTNDYFRTEALPVGLFKDISAE